MSKVPNFTKTQIRAAELVFASMAYEQTVSPIILKLQREAFEEVKIHCKPEYVARFNLPEFCTFEDMSMGTEEDLDKYYLLMNKKHIEAGFIVELGYCPLLMAQGTYRDARNLLIDEMKPITKMSFDMILQSSNSIENLKQITELTLRLLAPYCKNALKDLGLDSK